MTVDDPASAATPTDKGQSHRVSWPAPFGHTADDGDLADAYRHLMRVVGVLALLLAPVVAIGDWLIADEPLRGSISSYYYGSTGAYFVGTLCALGVFFMSYEYKPSPGFEADNLLSMGAALAAVVVALLPTSAQGEEATGGSMVVGAVHISSAVVLFILLAIFCLFQFTKSRDTKGVPLRAQLTRLWRDDGDVSIGKRRRNRIFRICGWVIVLLLVLGAVNAVLKGEALFWIEAAMVWAFGVAWLVKGGLIGDLEPR